jgi:hypothetical protein
LGGYANYWPRGTVDANLRAIPTTSAFLVGTFDKNSIMKYFFDAFMFVKGEQSPCYSPTENLVVSAQDLIGVRLAYPLDPNAVKNTNAVLSDTLQQINGSESASAIVREDAAIRLRVPAPH